MELELYKQVNKAETPEELIEAIRAIGEYYKGQIPGRTRTFDVEKQVAGVDYILKGYPYNLLTRNFGIRQQMMYIMHYR